MPKKSPTQKKKSTRQKTIRPTPKTTDVLPASAVSAVPANETVPAPAEKKYVVINEYDEKLESKKKLLWPIVGVLAVALVLFWFGTLRYTIKKSALDSESVDFSNQLTGAFADIQKVLQEAGEALKNINNTTTPDNLEQIKTDVLQQIRTNLDESTWPRYESEVIGISLQYPDGWRKEEKNCLGSSYG